MRGYYYYTSATAVGGTLREACLTIDKSMLKFFFVVTIVSLKWVQKLYMIDGLSYRAQVIFAGLSLSVLLCTTTQQGVRLRLQ